ncbi:MAG: TonB-dependent receptor plug domain-containing protein, partial [Candidatus Kapaibacterium sp.]
RTTLLLDNFPLLSADNADMSFDALPLFATQRIEVVKGSGSALYGSSAIGGVVNVLTKDPQGDADIKLRLVQGMYTRPRYEEWDWSAQMLQQRGVDLSYGQSFGKSSVIATAGVRTDDTHLKSNDSRRSNIYAKYATEPTSSSRLMVFGQFAYEDRANWVNWKNVRFATTPAVTADSGLRIHSNKAAVGAEWTERLSTASFLVGRLSRFQTWYRNTAPRDSSSFMTSDAGASVAEVQVTSQVMDALAVTCGITGTYNDVVSPQTRGTKSQSFLSTYLQSEWTLGSAAIATFGLRYDREQTVGETTNNEVSPKFGISYRLGDAGALRANIGRAFRAPAVLERFASIRFSGFTVGRNPLLRPETGWSAEIGGDYSFSLGPLPVSVEAAVFQNDLTDLIEPQFVIDATRSEIQFINITRARIHGIEAAVRTWLMKGLGIESSILAMSPRNVSTGRDLLFRHNLMWTSRLMAKTGAWGFQMDYRYLSRQVEVDERLGNLGLVVNADVRVPVHVVDARIMFDAT